MIPRPRGRHGGSEDGRHVEGDAGLDGDRCGAADASARGRLQEEGSAAGCWGGGRCGGWPRRGGARRLERARRGLAPEEDGILKDVHFAFDKYDLDSEARAILDRNADWLRQNSRAKIELEGHCDDRGTIEYNLALGAKRAK